MHTKTVSVLVAVATAIPAVVRAQDSQAVWRTQIGQSFGCIYTPPPRNADYVIFVGEPITLKISLSNGTDKVIDLAGRASRSPGRLVVASSRSAETVPSLTMEPADAATLISGTLRSELTVNWARSIGIQPGDRLEWIVRVVSARPVRPGRYEVGIVPDPTIMNRLSLVVGRPLVLEVREPRGFGSSMEILRRQGMWHYVNDDNDAAAASFDELLRRYPQSHIAHVMKGNIELRQGRREQASASYRTGLALLERGADRLYLTEGQPPRHAAEESLEHLRGMLRSLQRPKPLIAPSQREQTIMVSRPQNAPTVPVT